MCQYRQGSSAVLRSQDRVSRKYMHGGSYAANTASGEEQSMTSVNLYNFSKCFFSFITIRLLIVPLLMPQGNKDVPFQMTCLSNYIQHKVTISSLNSLGSKLSFQNKIKLDRNLHLPQKLYPTSKSLSPKLKDPAFMKENNIVLPTNGRPETHFGFLILNRALTFLEPVVVSHLKISGLF